MDIHTCQQASASRSFSNAVSSNLDLSYYDISFSVIDTQSLRVVAVTSNYEWHLCYWGYDLDKELNQRLITGVRTWNNYDLSHATVFAKCLPERNTKIDICTRHGACFEIMSVSSSNEMEFTQIISLMRLKPAISAMARNLCRKKQDELSLPLRSRETGRVVEKVAAISLINHDIWQFGHLTFTRLEMDSIRQLLMCRSMKEIAWAHQCSVKTEHNRLNNIKMKAGCPHHPNSSLFDILNRNGVTQACLENFTISR
ncbi:DNA-binding CsgD family transcriptional regulator [Erwinia toletana]|uniref:DNA-binding CsgD family transcriptional regulator n=1 Tax=Winslowiella toletana TaxID=92490 RepID=A0ABS4PDI0_9GAMM|nr:hypothetical protein [Winslowiella toletana]MBP2170667.1 DNA-binding CsgD family transcriptional regulator [Winslowiella toletana]